MRRHVVAPATSLSAMSRRARAAASSMASSPYRFTLSRAARQRSGSGMSGGAYRQSLPIKHRPREPATLVAGVTLFVFDMEEQLGLQLGSGHRLGSLAVVARRSRLADGERHHPRWFLSL